MSNINKNEQDSDIDVNESGSLQSENVPDTEPTDNSPPEETTEEVKENVTDEAAEAERENIVMTENGGEVSVEVLPDGTAVAVPKKLTFKSLCSGIRKAFERLGIPDMLLLRFAGVYFLFSGLNIADGRKESKNPISNWQEYVGNVELGKSIFLMVCVFLVLTAFYSAMPKKYRIIDSVFLIFSILYFDIEALWRINNFFICAGTMIVSLVFIYYALVKLKSARRVLMKVHWSICALVILALAVLVGWFVSFTTIYKHRNFGTSCFDFGIFVQMYHSLSENLTAVTTCERDRTLSHFYVHSSFVYYLLVPIYRLYPKEETLFISQAVLALGGVVPMFLIAKRHKFKGVSLIFMCLAYVFSVGLIGPCYYDFHENAFLPTLLMWLLWSVDAKKYIPFYIFSILVCTVKEDAPLYVVCIGMYLFFSEKGNKKRIHGLIISAISGVYMILITRWLTENGDGQFMTSTRFGILMINPEGGFGEIIKNVITNPAYFFTLLIKESTINFFVEVMLPLLFMPFVTKKINRYLLMMPFIITNMVVGAGYGYAANVGYQYIFGPICLLIYMSVINLEDLGTIKKHDFSVLMGAAAVILSIGVYSHQIGTYEAYKNSEEYLSSLDKMIDTIPQDASVACDAFVLPHIADRDEIYIFDGNDFNQETKTLLEPERYDFYVVPESFYDEWCREEFARREFILFDYIEGRFRIYETPEYANSH